MKVSEPCLKASANCAGNTLSWLRPWQPELPLPEGAAAARALFSRRTTSTRTVCQSSSSRARRSPGLPRIPKATPGSLAAAPRPLGAPTPGLGRITATTTLTLQASASCVLPMAPVGFVGYPSSPTAATAQKAEDGRVCGSAHVQAMFVTAWLRSGPATHPQLRHVRRRPWSSRGPGSGLRRRPCRLLSLGPLRHGLRQQGAKMPAPPFRRRRLRCGAEQACSASCTFQIEQGVLADPGPEAVLLPPFAGRPEPRSRHV